jgi:hypothetical protein
MSIAPGIKTINAGRNSNLEVEVPMINPDTKLPIVHKDNEKSGSLKSFEILNFFRKKMERATTIERIDEYAFFLFLITIGILQ